MSLTKVSFSMVEGAPFNVLDFGADPTGIADSTAAIIAALAAGGANCAIYLPRGTYKVTSEILVSQNRVHIYGDGRYATTLMFAPTANGALFKFEIAGSTINQGSICDLTIFSNDNTHVKYALRFIDITGYYISNVVIGGGVAIGSAGYWTDPSYSSYGIWIAGRDTTNFHNVMCFADKPIVVDPNPNVGPPPGIQISLDHFNFHNLYLSATFNPTIIFTSGVITTETSFTGFQAWVLGEGGLYWVDATLPGASQSLSFQNVRYENNRDPTKFMFHIESASGVQNLQVTGGQTAFTNCFKLAGVQNVSLESFFYGVTGPPGNVAMELGANCTDIHLSQCYWVSNSTVSLGSMQVQTQEAYWASSPLPTTGYLLEPLVNSGTYNEQINSTSGSRLFVLEAGAIIGIGKDTQVGHFLFATRDYNTAIYGLNGTIATTTEISDPGNLFSNTAGTPNQYNVYYSGANSRFELQNGFAVQKTLNFFKSGAGQ